MRRLLIAGGAIAVAVVLFLVLRPDDGEDSTTPTVPTATGETTTGVEPTPPPPAPPPPAPGPARVQIVIEGGLPVGGPRRVTVSQGRRVILLVNSDVADHVHLHGYDLMRDVGPGRTARLAFRATRLGTVEAELEDRGILIARITAQP